tara:strand:- start:467 stop:685 length:219 start_codon:yes stop_codon:yes gene_type:complete
MSSVYLTKEELKWLTDLDADEDDVYCNIWKKCHDKLEYIECSKELKKLNELQEQMDEIKKSIKNKSRGWGIK